ncbi:MAG: S8 family serine peptidase [Bacteroidota bacterium]
MKRSLSLLFIWGVIACTSLSAQSATQSVYLLLTEQAELSAIDAGLYERQASPAQRAERVITILQQTARRTQGPLIQWLRQLDGVVSTSIQTYWIANAIQLEATEAAIEQISRHPQVALVEREMQESIADARDVGPAEVRSAGGREFGHDMIKAPALWQKGYGGYGQSVMIIDTGVDSVHPALSGRYKGRYYPDRLTWFDNNGFINTPYDCSDHGTHVAGTAVGLDPNTQDTIGVAPDGLWMGASAIKSPASCDGSGGQFPIASLQWALNPDGDASTADDMPDVINCSFGIRYDDVQPTICNGIYASVLEALETAGIAVVWSAGNSNGQTQTLTGQANININLLNSFTVANLNPAGTINWSSSRGPSICGGNGPLFIKPEVAAPGEGIRSALPGGGYGLKTGTSMSAPHVAGAILLLKEAFPDLTGYQLKLALYESAVDIGATGEDNTYGRGIIDLEAAFDTIVNWGYSPAQISDDNDVEMTALLNIPPDLCDSVLSPIIHLHNRGTTTINSAEIVVRLSAELLDTMSWTGSLAVGDTMEIPLQTMLVETGGYDVRVEVISANGKADYHFLDNQQQSTMRVLADELAAVETEPVCIGSEGMFSVKGNGPGQVFWYDEAVGGNEIGSGSALLTGPLQADTLAWATVLYRRNGGKQDFDRLNGFADQDPDGGKAMVFDALVPFTLKSVTVYPATGTPRLIELRNAAGQLLQSSSFSGGIGFLPRVINLNFEVPVGENHRLLIATPQPGLFIDTAEIRFPYNITNALRIKGASPDLGIGAYYPYFFDWQIEYPGMCGRVAVPITVDSGQVVADFIADRTALDLPDTATVQFTDQSQGATQWQWSFGDGGSSQLQNPIHTYLYTGQYEVGLFAVGPDGCGDASSLIMDVGGVSTSLPGTQSGQDFRLYPNPSDGNVILEWSDNQGRTQWQWTLLSLEGQTIRRGKLEPHALQQRLFLTDVSPGLYILHLHNDQLNVSKKLLIRDR